MVGVFFSDRQCRAFSDQLHFYELTPAAAFKYQLIPLAAELQHASKPNTKRAQVWNKAIPARGARSGTTGNGAVTGEPREQPQQDTADTQGTEVNTPRSSHTCKVAPRLFRSQSSTHSLGKAIQCATELLFLEEELKNILHKHILTACYRSQCRKEGTLFSKAGSRTTGLSFHPPMTSVTISKYFTYLSDKSQLQ